MRVISFNANGIRSADQKGFLRWMHRQKADVVCLQEIRATADLLPKRIARPGSYHAFFHEAKKPGYSGVALYLARTPDRVDVGLGWEPFDREGRWIEAVYGSLRVVSFYMPSGSAREERQSFKFETMRRLLPRLQRLLDAGGETILCGDFNIAHKRIDLANWRGNQKSSGFLPEERAWLDQVYDRVGLVDAFRVANQSPGEYTWWSNRGQARAKNVGWRLDLQVVTPGLAPRVRAASIYRRRRFSDHAPLTIDYEVDL